MSALPPKADIVECDRHGRLVPRADIKTGGGIFGHVGPQRVYVRHGRMVVRPQRFTSELTKLNAEVPCSQKGIHNRNCWRGNRGDRVVLSRNRGSL